MKPSKLDPRDRGHWSAYARSHPHPKPTAQLVLYALAAFADGSGMGLCYPSMTELCRATSLALATVKRDLASLETEGYLTRRKRPGKQSVVTRLRVWCAVAGTACQHGAQLSGDPATSEPGHGVAKGGSVVAAEGHGVAEGGHVVAPEVPVRTNKDHQESRAREGQTLSLPIEELQPATSELHQRLESERAEHGLPDSPFVRRRIQEHLRIEAQQRKAKG